MWCECAAGGFWCVRVGGVKCSVSVQEVNLVRVWGELNMV